MTVNTHREVTPRDARSSFWIETSAPVLEGRLATQYAVANGYLGVRGTHEEMPAWASAGFFVAGTYCAGPPALVPIHTPDHILCHPERVKSEHHAEYAAITTMPNLPNPVAVMLSIGGERVELDAARILACERMMHIDRACMTRRLVIRDQAERRTIIDSERFASWANPRLVCFRYQVTADGHDAPVEVAPYIHDAVSNARGIRLFEMSALLETSRINTAVVNIHQPEQRLCIAQAYAVRREGPVTTLDVVVSVHEDVAVAQTTALAALHAGYDAQLADHLAAVAAARARRGDARC